MVESPMYVPAAVRKRVLAHPRKSLICIWPLDRHAGRGHFAVTLALWFH